MPVAPPCPTCWVISDGRRGIENQALGLAEAMARLSPLEIETKIIKNHGAFKALPPRAQLALKPKPQKYGFSAPWPNLAIGCGRQAIAPLLTLRKKGVFTVYVQDPRINPNEFDIVVAPSHDKVRGENVILMIGSPNRITADVLKTETEKFAQALARYPAPHIGVLIGGTSKTHRLTPEILNEHRSVLNDLVASGHSLFISTSRRTPDIAVKAYQAFRDDHPNVWLWDGADPTGDNPYYAFLGAADAVLVTEDSTNMMVEACATGNPVYTLAMNGKSGKFSRLYQDLDDAYGVKRFHGDIQKKTRPPLAQTDIAAENVWARYAKTGIKG